jgi:hypothetical protein
VATFYGKMLDHDYTTKEALPESDDGKGERCGQVWCLDLFTFLYMKSSSVSKNV